MFKTILFTIVFVTNIFSQELILGKIDKFDLPDLNLKSVRAKIDTGAKTSSLHCMTIKPTKDGYVKFITLDENNKKFTGNYITKKISRIANVKSSNGTIQTRYFIQTPIVIYNKTYNIELSLSFRGSMKFPLLIGRELIKQDFLVDVTKKDLSFNASQLPQ
ncbi:MAG: ATP-dependent zinc protease [Arcobacteraceae bacterium]|nr:ATP-dependent zinc protease [Arcobacteraceae bacterium]